MYGIPFDVDESVLSEDFTVPIGKAKIEREGWCILLSMKPYLSPICLKGHTTIVQQKWRTLNLKIFLLEKFLVDFLLKTMRVYIFYK